MLGNGHAGFGRRPGETHQWQHRQGAPGRPHRTAGDTHHQALRALGNRLVGILHGCLRHHTIYSEHTAWAHRQPTPDTRAA